MIKKILSSLLIAASLLATSAFAMQISVGLSDDITANKDAINIAFDIYTSQGPGINLKNVSMDIKAVPFDKFQSLMTSLNLMLADANPVDAINGEHSQVTLGYQKADGTIVTPASCQNILARPVMNIELSESGCIVS